MPDILVEAKDRYARLVKLEGTAVVHEFDGRHLAVVVVRAGAELISNAILEIVSNVVLEVMERVVEEAGRRGGRRRWGREEGVKT